MFLAICIFRGKNYINVHDFIRSYSIFVDHTYGLKQSCVSDFSPTDFMAKKFQQRFNFYVKRSVYFLSDLHKDFTSQLQAST